MKVQEFIQINTKNILFICGGAFDGLEKLIQKRTDNASLGFGSQLDLFDWAFASFADRPLVDTQTVLTTVDLTKCRTEPAVELYAAAPVSGYGHADDIVTYSFDLPESVAATVKSGSVVGTATVYLDGDEVGTVNLVTHREYVSDFRTDTKATVLLLCALLFILAALTAVTLAAGGGSLSLKKRRRRR